MAIFRFSFLVCISLFLVACGDDPIDLSTISGMNRALEANPSDTTARYARARYYLQNGKADSALVDMQTLIKVDSSRVDYFLTLGDIYLVTNRTR